MAIYLNVTLNFTVLQRRIFAIFDIFYSIEPTAVKFLLYFILFVFYI